MADYTMDTNESALNEANAIARSIADSGATPDEVGKLRLFDNPFTPNADTVKADMVAVETVLGGYPVGGYPITDMAAALSADGGGAVTTTPMIDIRFTVAPAATLSGWWLEDSTGAVRKCGVFDPPRSLNAVGQGFEFVRQLLYGRNA